MSASTPDDLMPTTGPIPLYVRTTPTAVVLDLAALTQLVVSDVVEALLDPEDTGLWDQLHDLAETERMPVAGRLLGEELVTDLTERASSQVPLYGHAARLLAERLLRVSGPRPVPSQREAGAA